MNCISVFSTLKLSTHLDLKTHNMLSHKFVFLLISRLGHGAFLLCLESLFKVCFKCNFAILNTCSFSKITFCWYHKWKIFWIFFHKNFQSKLVVSESLVNLFCYAENRWMPWHLFWQKFSAKMYGIFIACFPVIYVQFL